ncbi:MAG: mobile mystery protein B [Gammaproteobacteria bacterium]
MSSFDKLGDEFDDDGTTPLDPDEREGLKYPHIQTRGELNAAEQSNIQDGFLWLARQRSFRQLEYLTEEFLLSLHRRMFGKVWAWAGRYRNSEKSIGVYPGDIGPEVRKLLDDARYWVEQGTWNREHFAARFHHRLEQIHPFPNGNGRHGRIMTDTVLTEILQQAPVDWLAGGDPAQRRVEYIAALRSADTGDYGLLERFIKQTQVRD